MTAIAYPFLRPPEDCVLASGWTILEDGAAVELDGGHLCHFDYSTALTVSRRMQINFGEFAHSIGVDPEELVVECVSFAGSGGARLDRRRRLLDRQAVTTSAPTISVELAIAGDWLSNTLNLTTELVLASAGTRAQRLAPRIPGARLWRDQCRFSVEPTAPRFPMEVVSFCQMFPEQPAGALWFLDWSPGDMAQEFTAAVRLYINEDVPELIERVHGADDLTLQLLLNGVVVQMARTALLSLGSETLEGDKADISVAGVVRDWISRSFPGQTIASVRTLAEFDPARFEVAIAAMASGTALDV